MDKLSTKGTMFSKEEGRSIRGDEIFPDEHVITIHEGSNSKPHEISGNEREWLNSFEKSRDYPGSLQNPKMQRVPKMHREIKSNVRCYEPLVVSIGPFHHGKPELQPMEKYKKLLAIQLTEEKRFERKELLWLSTNSVSLDELYRKVKDIIPDVKECYDEDSIKDYNDEEFAQMIFLDGCFILEYLHCIVTGRYKELKMKSHGIAFILRDLFLLENQLPFKVLDVLMSCKLKNNVGMEMIKEVILSAPTNPHQHPESHTCTEKAMKTLLPAHLLEILKKNLINTESFSENGCYLRGDWCSYRSAMELRRAGIHFRPGKSRHLSDIKFTSFHCSALLTLPPITIDDSTKSQFLNLAAYEACPDTPDDFGITSYISFMDSLIDHAEELRSKGILLNFLGSDQEVADMFNELARDLVPNPHAFVDVKDKIEKHYNNKGKIWIAEWMNSNSHSLAFESNQYPWNLQPYILEIHRIVHQLERFKITHVYREANNTADRLSKYSHNTDIVQHFYIKDQLPTLARGSFILEKLGMANFRRKKLKRIKKPP